jgi:hypothetical protein
MTQSPLIREVPLKEAMALVQNASKGAEVLEQWVGQWSGPFKVYDGDLVVEGNLEFGHIPTIVWGNLRVGGCVSDMAQGVSLFIVLGDIHTTSLATRGNIGVTGDLIATDAVFGYSQDATLWVAGQTRTRVLINHSHRFDLLGQVSADFVYGHFDTIQHTGLLASELFVDEVLEVPEGAERVLAQLKPKRMAERLTHGLPVLQEHPTSRRKDMLRELEDLERKAITLEDAGLREIPEEVFRTMGLEKLVLDFNEIDQLPDAIGDLVQLRYLSLDDLPMRRLPESIGSLHNLEVLSLRFTKIKTFPKRFEELQSLREIYLTYSSLEQFPEVLKRLANLERLSFWHCGPEDPEKLRAFIEAIAQIPSLRSLAFAQGSIRVFPENVAKLQMLEEFQIVDQKVTESGLEALRQALPGARIKLGV